MCTKCNRIRNVRKAIYERQITNRIEKKFKQNRWTFFYGSNEKRPKQLESLKRVRFCLCACVIHGLIWCILHQHKLIYSRHRQRVHRLNWIECISTYISYASYETIYSFYLFKNSIWNSSYCSLSVALSLFSSHLLYEFEPLADHSSVFL